jgi:meso-butanediol dehydrogenase/(S,S)-butanediol dehydrogenase/diacetyl reductase
VPIERSPSRDSTDPERATQTISSEATDPPRKAVVTGGASGFGLGVARALHESGSDVAIVDVARPALDSAIAQLGRSVLALEADVSSAAAIRMAVRVAETEFGGLDTLVISAGVIHLKALDDVTEDDWDRVLDVNLKGAFLAAQAAAAPLRASGRGRIVSIASDAAKRGCDHLQAYSASKFGVVGLTESLAAELAGDAVTVNCVCPVGCPATGMGALVAAWKSEQTGRPREEILSAAASTNPVGRNATVADVTNAVMFLVSDAASFLTGLALDVDGGAHVGRLPGVQ